MDISGIIAIGTVVVGVAGTWGALRVRIKTLEASQRDQGRRIGELEKWRAFEEGRGGRRRPSRTFKAEPALAAEEDESGPGG